MEACAIYLLGPLSATDGLREASPLKLTAKQSSFCLHAKGKQINISVPCNGDSLVREAGSLGPTAVLDMAKRAT